MSSHSFLSLDRGNNACSSSLSPLIQSESRDFLKGTFSRSSAFCNLSSSSSSDTKKHLGTTLPFLPNPSTQRSSSSVSFTEDFPLSNNNPFDGGDDSFLTLSGDACSDGRFQDLGCLNDSFGLSEEMDLQFLSDDLELAITDRAETPRLDEIYQVDVSSPVQNCVPAAMSVISQPSPGSVVKPRMRWSPELHECFLEAVKKLDGPEKATPKAVMKLMNVEGLTIYQVKSHLQKYRLAKYMPERKEEKKNGNSEDKKAALNTIEADGRKKGTKELTEALRMQMEVQKQLHEQLEVQRSLQLRIEEHAKYLEKILEEQSKATQESKNQSKTEDASSTQLASSAKNKASEPVDSICETSPKRPRLENKDETEEPKR